MDNKTHFILGTNPYMFLHQVPSSRSFLKTKDHMSNMYLRCQSPSLSS